MRDRQPACVRYVEVGPITLARRLNRRLGNWVARLDARLGPGRGQPIRKDTAWACNVIRTLPGRGVQALSVPADVEPRPEGMGLLVFSPADAAPAAPAPKMHPVGP